MSSLQGRQITKNDAKSLYKPSKQKGHVRLTDERKAEFLELVAEYGVLYRAALAIGVTPGAIRMARKDDEDFENAINEALEIYRERVQLTISNRAIEGWDEPVYYQGQQCGSVRKYSDNLLLAEAKRVHPDYREKQQHEHNVKGGVCLFAPQPNRQFEDPANSQLESVNVDEEN